MILIFLNQKTAKMFPSCKSTLKQDNSFVVSWSLFLQSTITQLVKWQSLQVYILCSLSLQTLKHKYYWFLIITQLFTVSESYTFRRKQIIVLFIAVPIPSPYQPREKFTIAWEGLLQMASINVFKVRKEFLQTLKYLYAFPGQYWG